MFKIWSYFAKMQLTMDYHIGVISQRASVLVTIARLHFIDFVTELTFANGSY